MTGVQGVKVERLPTPFRQYFNQPVFCNFRLRQVHQMNPGDVAFVPRETVHAFKNTGEDIGRLRYIFTPSLKMEAMFRAFYAAEISTGIDEAAMQRIATDHGQTFVGPPL